MHKEEKFNELDIEIKDQKAFSRKSKFVLEDRDILEMIEPERRNFEIARRIEQVVKSYQPKSICLDVLQSNDSFEENQCRIVMLDDLLINAVIDNDEYQINGHIDEQSIVHITISKVAHNHTSSSYSKQSSDEVRLNIEGDFGIYLECTIDVHESQLEQSIIEALDALQRKYTVHF